MTDDIGGCDNVVQPVWQNVSLIDHKHVEWRRVSRARYYFYQQFTYNYPGTIRDLRQRLIVIPASRYGDQVLTEKQLVVTPCVNDSRLTRDHFGNHVFECAVSHVESRITFEAITTLERSFKGEQSIRVSRRQAETFLSFTRLTTPDAFLKGIAAKLKRQHREPFALAGAISDWVYANMRYAHGYTSVFTPASDAIAIGAGLCQDYAHVMLALCRSAGLSARYISGHMLGEGGSHAWVEALIPSPRSADFIAAPFDPTNDRQPHAGYITVAVGRDYRDVSPTSGTFSAPFEGVLTCSKRAGLTHIEYH